jgi:hypothetical protein
MYCHLSQSVLPNSFLRKAKMNLYDFGFGQYAAWNADGFSIFRETLKLKVLVLLSTGAQIFVITS